MVSIHFDEYLRTLHLAEEKTKVRPPLLALTRKNSGISANLDTLTVWINEIYQLIKSNLGKNSRFNPQDKVREFNRRLHNLKDKFIFFCEELYIEDEQATDYSVKSGEQLFSEFLQHLFIYTTEHIKDTIYISQLMEEILVNYTADFFYSLVEGESRSITVWIDPLSKSTALLAAAEVAQPNTFNMLTDVLSVAFLNSEVSLEETSVVSPALHRYLLHEDEDGFSTLSIIWARADSELIRLFLGWARRFYGDSESLGFKRFLFQIDEEGLSSLNRAVEKGDLGLVCLLFEGVKHVYGSETERGFQQFLFYRDKTEATILNRVSRLDNYVLTKKIIETATIAFRGKENPDFQDFLFLPDIEGKTALISAAQGGHRKLLKLLSREAEQAYKGNKQKLFQFMLHQDKDGFNAVMRAVEMDQRACVASLLNLLLDFLMDSPRFFDVVENSFKLQKKDGFSLLHLAVQCRSVEMLAFLLARFHQLFGKELTDFCSLKDKNNLTPLELILYEEKDLRIELKEKNRLVTSQEKIASKQRIVMIREFLAYDIQLPRKDSFFILDDVFSRKAKSLFFSIFCFRSQRMVRTTQFKACVFNNEDYDAFFPKDFSQVRKEALVNLVSFLQKSHFSFINQVASIRNSGSTLQTDQLLLKGYKESVNQFYEQYGPQILSTLKRTSVINLESAWQMTHTDDLLYILADNGHDLLIFNKKGVFSANLLNPTQSVGLRYHLSGFELNDWLTRYFSPDFTLYAFYPSVLAEYPSPFDQLKLSFFFDENFLVKKIRGLHYKTIQDLFLIEGNKIQLADFSTPDFFSIYARKIGFRPEKFYDIYFKLDLNEKLNLQRLFKKQVIPIHSYLDLDVLTVEEKNYFNLYGAYILRLLTKSNDFSPIYLGELFDDVAVPGPFLAYRAVIKNQTLEDLLPAYSHYQDTQHSLESPLRMLSKESTESRGMWKDLTYGLLGTAGFIGMGLATLFIKRFRRSGQAVALHAGTVLPLLETQQPEALEKKQEDKAIHLPKIAWTLSEKTDFSYLSFIRGREENTSLPQETEAFRMKVEPLRRDPYANIDQQLMLGFWLGRHIEKLFFKSYRHKSHFYRNKEKTDVYFANKITKNPSFFSQSKLFVDQNPSLLEEKSLNFSHYTRFN